THGLGRRDLCDEGIAKRREHHLAHRHEDSHHDDPDERALSVASHDIGGHHDNKGASHKDHAQSRLLQQAHVSLLALCHLLPYHGEYRSQDDTCDGVHGIKPGCGHLEGADHPVGVVQIGGTVSPAEIVVCRHVGHIPHHPEDNRKQSHEDDCDDAL